MRCRTSLTQPMATIWTSTSKGAVRHGLCAGHLGKERRRPVGRRADRLRLAKLLLEKPDVLILDEPTNHLDFATMEWLENYLKSYSGAVLVVSHDRYFLDHICTKIWEVSFQTMTTYKGNFSAYLPQKEAADALRQKQHDADVALAEKLQDYVDRNLVRASTTKWPRAAANSWKSWKLQRPQR